MAGTTASVAPPAPRWTARRVLGNRLALWTAFVLVHAELLWIALTGPGLPLGDVTLVYTTWMKTAASSGYVVGLDGPFVYPILAILPMGLAAMFGFDLYVYAWLGLVVLLNAGGFAVLIGLRRGPVTRFVPAWWWLGFLILLGPIAVGRIDAVTVPIALVAVLLVAGRPRLASVLLAVATWIKIWPAAVIAALLIASRERLRIFLAAAATSVLIVVVCLVLGSGWNVFSFITEQTGRGLQIESPVSTIWLWQAAAGSPTSWVYYDHDILTYQVTGQGTEFASAVMTPLLLLVVGVIVAIGIRAQLQRAPFVALFPPLALALVTAFIVVNKVGSPQFICWLAVPVVVGLVYRGRRFAVPAVMTLVLAGLTQLIYPFFYGWLLVANPLAVSLLTLRNLLEVALLVLAVVMVWRSGSHAEPAADADADADAGEGDPVLGAASGAASGAEVWKSGSRSPDAAD
ncbi:MULTISPECIES: glycosyltransferase 87 family protein [unclassified Leifsonia]|uniref:glycosyltransferase 87 family protein n=1 Tax=unclassified Leifsonia TaxID=2663824 RepID=UPI0009EBD055|nr:MULTISPECIES: glycosyltransferase 87 family protein [unclassified Leifsonia]